MIRFKELYDRKLIYELIKNRGSYSENSRLSYTAGLFGGFKHNNTVQVRLYSRSREEWAEQMFFFTSFMERSSDINNTRDEEKISMIDWFFILSYDFY